MKHKLLTCIRITKLFGIYSYTLPEENSLSDASILYGDNGAGKSTLLKLVFHLLSVSNERGHRTALLNGEYESLEVDLDSGVTLIAQKITHENLTFLRLVVKKDNVILAYWDHFPKNEGFLENNEYEFVIADGIPQIKRAKNKKKKLHLDAPEGNEIYLETLSKHVPAMFILDAERRLASDEVSNPSDEVELRKMIRADSPRIPQKEMAARSREIALSQALSSAAHWIGNKAILGTNQGSVNVHSVYVEILNHLLSPKSRPNEEISGEALIDKLNFIQAQMERHSVYELATNLSTRDFQKALSKDKSTVSIASNLLRPYIASLEKKLEAVEPIYRVIDKFVTILNNFLADKNISFKLSRGFKVTNIRGVELQPGQLSSGEQQLLLLFCYVLTARDRPSVFMIDEPEISLNIKWQRQLIRSLLEVSEGADIQFIFASHSLELLAQHRNKVVKLHNQNEPR